MKPVQHIKQIYNKILDYFEFLLFSPIRLYRKILHKLKNKLRRHTPKPIKTSIKFVRHQTSWQVVRRRIKYFLLFIFYSGISLIVVLFFYLRSVADRLPDPHLLSSRNINQGIVIYDRNGKELFNFYNGEKREFVKIEDVPNYLKWSVLASEDAGYYEHKGLDYSGIFSCAFRTLLFKVSGGRVGVVCGASTITQQLVRNTIMYDVYGDKAFERSDAAGILLRKTREMLLTIQVEQTYSKDEILQMYLNEVPFGGVNYGVQAVARSFFGKNVNDLTLAESAILAGLLQNPTRYNPIFGTEPEMAVVRQQYVLNQLERISKKSGIATSDITAAKEQKLVYARAMDKIEAPHFALDIYHEILKQYGDTANQKGFRVYTTLDLDTQHIAEKIVQDKIAEFSVKYGAFNAGVVMVDPNTGELLAMVGSADFFSDQNPFNSGQINATTSLRQMASSVKPYVYIGAIERGYGLWMLIPDFPIDYGYGVSNFQNEFNGLVTARKALVTSSNVAAMYTQEMLGISEFESIVKRLGITSISNLQANELTAAIGSKEISLYENTYAFSVFAAEGVKRPPVKILKITDYQGNQIFTQAANAGEEIFSKEATYILNWALCDLGGFNDTRFAESGVYNIDGQRALCGKTGTSDGVRDAISMMYDKNLVVGTWVGNSNNVGMPGGGSAILAMPISHEIIAQTQAKYPIVAFTAPEGIHETEVCTETGQTAGKNTPDCNREKSIYFGDFKPVADTRHWVSVCKANGLIPANLSEVNLVHNAGAGFDSPFYLLDNRLLFIKQLENSRHQSNYEAYLQAVNNKYVVNQIGTAYCPLPENVEIIDNQVYIFNEEPGLNWVLPQSQQVYDVQIDLELLISFIVSGNSKNSHYQIMIDNLEIASGNLNFYMSANIRRADTAYNFAIPKNFSGEHTVTVIISNPEKGLQYPFSQSITIK
ncbi:MAG: transglycosylase domain-containing protein [bacterium]